MNSVIGGIEELSIGPNYWQSHWFWLAVAWFGGAFVALVIRKKVSESIIARILRGAIYLGVYFITFSLAAASFWRLSPIFYRFDSWPFWRRTHLLVCNPGITQR